METETMTGEAFAAKYGVTLTYKSHGAQRDDDGWEHNAYTVTLAYGPPATEKAAYTTGGRREVSLPWRQGYGVEGVPEVGGVLENVALDLDTSRDFDEWAADYGYDTDSRKAYATFELSRKIGRNLYDWCKSEAMWDDLRAVQES